jgi:hypothetical protein
MEKIFARVVARKDSSESELSIRLALVGVEASLHYVEFTDRTDKCTNKFLSRFFENPHFSNLSFIQSSSTIFLYLSD